MPGPKQMVAGFNHNVKHAGKLYHVQTEDSGLQNPRITTHLFVGGNIIASKTTSYAELVGAEDVNARVRTMMEEQHKEMLRELVAGAHDDADAARSYQPGQLADEPPRREPPALPRPARAPVASAPRPPPPPPAAAPRAPPPPPRAVAQAAPAPRPAPVQQAAPLFTPPPVLRRQVDPAPRPAPVAAAPKAPARAANAPAPPPRAPPPPTAFDSPVETLFGEDLISEKSLDEVILSYLAEDLGGRK